jgi:DNA polymerase-1
MNRYGVEVRSFDDTMLMSYVLDAGTNGGHGMDPLSERWLGHTPIAYKDVTGSGKRTSASTWSTSTRRRLTPPKMPT